MRRLEKEILRIYATGNIGAAYELAKLAGYHVEVYDGDIHTGPFEPVLNFSRLEQDATDK